jgi:hypothetical protein
VGSHVPEVPQVQWALAGKTNNHISKVTNALGHLEIETGTIMLFFFFFTCREAQILKVTFSSHSKLWGIMVCKMP